MEKIRAIVKRTDEQYGHVTNISNTLKDLQNAVDLNPQETEHAQRFLDAIFEDKDDE